MLSCGGKWAGCNLFNASPLSPLRDDRCASVHQFRNVCTHSGERFLMMPVQRDVSHPNPEYFINKFFSLGLAAAFAAFCLLGCAPSLSLLTKYILSKQHTRDKERQKAAGDLWSGKVQEMGGRKDERVIIQKFTAAFWLWLGKSRTSLYSAQKSGARSSSRRMRKKQEKIM